VPEHFFDVEDLDKNFLPNKLVELESTIYYRPRPDPRAAYFSYELDGKFYHVFDASKI
jgi:hypothetical protein